MGGELASGQSCTPLDCITYYNLSYLDPLRDESFGGECRKRFALTRGLLCLEYFTAKHFVYILDETSLSHVSPCVISVSTTLHR